MADKTPYGDVEYADPGLQKDKKKRYPIDTAEHAKAAWSYINQGDNAAQYSSGDLAKVKSRIMAACKKFGITVSDTKRSDDPELLGVRPFECRSYLIEDMTVRSDGDGRTVEAYAAAFNARAEIRDQDGHYHEVLAPGSFDRTIAHKGMRFGVFYNHARTIWGTPDGALSVPIGVPVEPPRPDGHGVLTVTRYLDNPLADSVLDAIKHRAITAQSFSGRFVKSMRATGARGELPTITRNEVDMREYGPAAFAAYPEAHIVGTRSAEAFMTDLLRMDPAERAELFHQMQALATPMDSASLSATPDPGLGLVDDPRADYDTHSARRSLDALRIAVRGR